MAYDITLPIGAEIQIGEQKLYHLGGGAFRSAEPLWLVDGMTVDGSDADTSWPDYIRQEVTEIIPRPCRRRVVMVVTPDEIQRQIWLPKPVQD